MVDKKTKSLKHNPWIIGTGTAIFGVIGIRILDFISGTNIIGGIIKFIKLSWFAFIDFFLSKYEVSLWFLILLPIVFVGIFIFVIWVLSLSSHDKNTILNSRPLFLDYKEDNLGGVLYRWDYFKNYSDKYEVTDISYFCPTCKCTLVDYRCPICSSAFHHNIKYHDEINALIRHKIETQITKRN